MNRLKPSGNLGLMRPIVPCGYGGDLPCQVWRASGIKKSKSKKNKNKKKQRRKMNLGLTMLLERQHRSPKFRGGERTIRYFTNSHNFTPFRKPLGQYCSRRIPRQRPRDHGPPHDDTNHTDPSLAHVCAENNTVA